MLLKKFPRRAARSKLFWFLVVIFLIAGFYGAKYVYDLIREPNFYKPNGVISFTTPIGTISNGQTVTAKEPGTSAVLPSAKWVPQTFNNCGPATTSMVLQYFGHNVSQVETKAALRTNEDDKNVFTYEISDYLKANYGISSKLLYGGNVQLLKKLLANGFYVVTENWLHPNEDIGHTMIIRGFDDAQGVFIADDSYFGVGVTYPYDQFNNTQWKAFNYEYLPVYLPANEDLLKSIIGDSWDQKTMFQHAADKARGEISANQSDLYAWFNLGSSLYGSGDYQGAKTAFEKSQSLGWPKRMLWYQIQPLETYNATGDYQMAISVADLALWSNDSFAEAHLEKAIAYKGLGNTQQARDEANKALSYYPNFKKAQDFVTSL